MDRPGEPRPGEQAAMRRAVALSARGLGTTSPNPPVGCVLLSPAGGTVGEGWHERAGEPHAEARALRAAGTRAAGATAVVTLEPCNHAGRTPACRQALLDAGVARVVVALVDPTSQGEGGVAVLRAHGVDVEVGVLADEARTVIGPWLWALEHRRPHVTVAAGALDDRRFRYDIVVEADGSVTEGLPGGHGPGALAIPAGPADLAALFAGGARTALVAAAAAAPFRAAGAVDVDLT